MFAYTNIRYNQVSASLKENTFHGTEIVDSAARLCAMNLYLHGIGTDQSPVNVADSLLSEPKEHYDLVLTNPPFGSKKQLYHHKR